MLVYQIVILSIIQGLTEFLPISSSAHLILTPKFFGWADQGLAMDVAVHVGTLGAVLCYFWRDVLSMARGAFKLLRGEMDDHAKLFLWLVIGTVPAVIIGFLFSYFNVTHYFRSIGFIAFTTITFGIVLYIFDYLGEKNLTFQNMTFLKSLGIGCAQAIALMPGTSRSGICMAAARLLGFARLDAARFSFLLSIPSIIAAATLEGFKVYKEGNIEFYSDAGIAVVVSLIAGLGAIHFMMTWLRNSNFTPFVLYRIALGVLLLILALQ